jgi:Actin like proteins N terminal domain
MTYSTSTKPQMTTSNHSEPQMTTKYHAGLDVGNSTLKFAINGLEKRVPSAIREVFSGQIDAPPSGGMVHYLDGDRKDLIGKTWVIGETALIGTHVSISEGVDNKPAYALQSLLGLLAMVSYRSSWDIKLVASVHTRSLRPDMESGLRGRHQVVFNAGDRVSEINITLQKVVDEGAGALLSVPNATAGKTCVLDIGYGTTQVSLFDKGRRIESHTPNNTGVEVLVKLICDELESRLKDTPDRSVVIKAIENGSFKYGNINFAETYREKVGQWIAGNVAPVMSHSRNWRLHSDQVIAIGGGSALLSEVLKQKDFNVPPSPEMVNVRGLLAMSQMIGG